MKKKVKYFKTSILAALLFFGCSEKRQTTRPVVSDLTISVYASAEIVPKNSYKVFASVPGIMEEWFVEVGDTVYKGQLIAQIQNDHSSIQVESANLNYKFAFEKYKGNASLIQNIQNDIALNSQKVSQDSINYRRQSNLWSKKIGSQLDYENAKMKFDLARNQRTALFQKLYQTEQELKTAYLHSQKNLESAMNQLGDYGVRSLISGKVFAINKKRGELVSLQQEIAVIGDKSEYLISMWVDEQDISLIREGQVVFLSLEAFPEESFEGTVTHIAPQKNASNQSFKIEAVFMKQPTVLFSGLSGEANIVLREKQKVLLLPQSFMSTDSTVITNGGEVKVKTGERNLSLIEIISGIDSSTTVIFPENK